MARPSVVAESAEKEGATRLPAADMVEATSMVRRLMARDGLCIACRDPEREPGRCEILIAELPVSSPDRTSDSIPEENFGGARRVQVSGRWDKTSRFVQALRQADLRIQFFEAIPEKVNLVLQFK